MGLNDKIKGSYYKNYESRLASKSVILSMVDELKNYYTILTKMIDEVEGRISSDRIEMKEKLNSIIVKLKSMEYVINNFKFEVDSSIQEKLKRLLENYDQDFINIVSLYDTDFYNHAKLEDTYASKDTAYVQPAADYEKSIEKLNTSTGIRWFGGKIKDSVLLNKLKSLLHIVKINTVDGVADEDYINSNLILDLFFYSKKGITWLTIGKNSRLGYNIKVKYNSLRNKSYTIKLAYASYYNQKSYDLNKFDMNMLLDLGYTADDLNNGNIYFKLKTNIPANTYSGLDEYYLSNTDKFNNYTDRYIVKNLSGRQLRYSNKDHAYNTNRITDIKSFRDNNKKFDKKTKYITKLTSTEYNKNKAVDDDSFVIYNEIKMVSGRSDDDNEIISSTKRSSDNKIVAGTEINSASTVINTENINIHTYNLDYLEGKDYRNKVYEKQSIYLNENKKIVNLTDRNRNDTDNMYIIAQNETTFINGTDDNDISRYEYGDNLKSSTNPIFKNNAINDVIINSVDRDDFSQSIYENTGINYTSNSNLFTDTFILKEIEYSSNRKLILFDNGILVTCGDKNIKVHSETDTGTIRDMINLNDGNVYLFTANKGIRVITKAVIENGSFNVTNTSVTTGNFNSACISADGNSFYAININGTVQNSNGKFVLTDYLYIFDTSIPGPVSLNQYFTRHNLANTPISFDTNTLPNKLLDSEKNNTSISYFKKYGLWFINKNNVTLYTSDFTKVVLEDSNLMFIPIKYCDNSDRYFFRYIDQTSSNTKGKILELDAVNVHETNDLIFHSVDEVQKTVNTISKREKIVLLTTEKLEKNTLDYTTNLPKELEAAKINGITYAKSMKIIDDTMFILSAGNCIDVMKCNGYYYVRTTNVLYKVNTDLEVTARIILSSEINRSRRIFTYNNNFVIGKAYTDKETLKVNNIQSPSTNNFNIISTTNK